MLAAELIVYLVLAYAAAGLSFAVYFSVRGVTDLSAGARDGGFVFRLIIIPAAAALWPYLLFRTIKRHHSVLESNAHRDAAEGRPVE